MTQLRTPLLVLVAVIVTVAGPIAVAPAASAVTSAFSQRRKLLRHTLGQWLAQKDFTGTFDLQRRAEEVPVSEYVALARAVAALPPSAGR